MADVQARAVKARPASGRAPSCSRPAESSPGHEPVEIESRTLTLVVAAVVAMLLVASAVAYALARHFAAAQPDAQPRPTAATLAQLQSIFPAPLLEPAPAIELGALQSEKSAMLNGYRWLDRPHGVVQIPIERAMELIASGRRSDER